MWLSCLKSVIIVYYKIVGGEKKGKGVLAKAKKENHGLFL